MNPSLETLCQLRTKKERLIIGLMSGTSQDGVDVALCNVTGSGTETKASVIEFEAVEYPEEIKNTLKQISYRRENDLQLVALMNAKLGHFYASCINNFIDKFDVERQQIDAVASHGQTIFHAPAVFHEQEEWPDATLQIGDGDHIARHTGLFVISDFRQKEIAAGGEGAPLAGYAEYLLFGNSEQPLLLVNIGGISNCTVLNGNKQWLTTDLGPGNTLIDEAVQRYYPDKKYDDEGAIAASGTVNQAILDELLEHPFLKKKLPKSTGQESFNMDVVDKALRTRDERPAPADVIASLTQFTADVITDSLNELIDIYELDNPEIVISGGGVYNKTLMGAITSRLPDSTVSTSDAIGVEASAKEALLFAVLANETLSGEGFEGRDGHPFTMGKISLPY